MRKPFAALLLSLAAALMTMIFVSSSFAQENRVVIDEQSFREALQDPEVRRITIDQDIVLHNTLEVGHVNLEIDGQGRTVTASDNGASMFNILNSTVTFNQTTFDGAQKMRVLRATDSSNVTLNECVLKTQHLLRIVAMQKAAQPISTTQSLRLGIRHLSTPSQERMPQRKKIASHTEVQSMELRLK